MWTLQGLVFDELAFLALMPSDIDEGASDEDEEQGCDSTTGDAGCFQHDARSSGCVRKRKSSEYANTNRHRQQLTQIRPIEIFVVTARSNVSVGTPAKQTKEGKSIKALKKVLSRLFFTSHHDSSEGDSPDKLNCAVSLSMAFRGASNCLLT